MVYLAPLPPNATATTGSATPLQAFQRGSLGVGFSGSGFLILYFSGVVAVLQALGVIRPGHTVLAGSSGGAITAAAVCAGVPPRQQLQANLGIASRCRPSACRGALDAAVRSTLDATLPRGRDAARGCERTLFVTLTEARPGGAPDVPLLASNLTSREQVLDAAAASAFLPFWSGPSAVTRFGAGGLSVYDGGLSVPLPCPPRVDYCVRVGSRAPAPDTPPPPAVAPGPALEASPRAGGEAAARGYAGPEDATLGFLSAGRSANDTASGAAAAATHP